MDWNTLLSHKRFGKEPINDTRIEYRTEFQRDYDRLIFSSSFRRLQNKTQVFPLPGSIFVHNRLTHSLEVSSVGRSLGTDVTRALIQKNPALNETNIHALGAIVSAACLAHDMGNPPFGHSGEKAIASYFTEGNGLNLKEFSFNGECLTDVQWTDFTRFDGNANTFRLLTHQFDGRRPGGFVMTYATLASIVKYPYSSAAATGSKFGFFDSERATYQTIAKELGIPCKTNFGNKLTYVRHPLVYLVEAADDICYEIMDIEDAHKLRILSDEKTQELLFAFFEPDQQKHIRSSFQEVWDVNEQIVYLRSCVINILERACVAIFVDHEEEILRGDFKGRLMDYLPTRMKVAYCTCEIVSKEKIYRCKDVLNIDLAGYHIIYTLLDLMITAVLKPTNAYSDLLISQVSKQYQLNAPSLYGKIQAVLDYISGMTDVFALDLYRKINGHSLPMV